MFAQLPGAPYFDESVPGQLTRLCAEALTQDECDGQGCDT
ncbi:protein of unknown function (plasmid) [Caballeronia sp. S22]